MAEGEEREVDAELFADAVKSPRQFCDPNLTGVKSMFRIRAVQTATSTPA